MKDWDESALIEELQNVVNTKELKYKRNNKWTKNYDENWLLISDIHNIMGTSNSEVDGFRIIVSSKLFHKVFLIQNIINNYNIIKIKT